MARSVSRPASPGYQSGWERSGNMVFFLASSVRKAVRNVGVNLDALVASNFRRYFQSLWKH